MNTIKDTITGFIATSSDDEGNVNSEMLIALISKYLQESLEGQKKVPITCAGNVKEGTPCKSPILVRGTAFCVNHQKQSAQGEHQKCSGTTAKGIPCERSPKTGTLWCSSHQPLKVDGDVPTVASQGTSQSQGTTSTTSTTSASIPLEKGRCAGFTVKGEHCRLFPTNGFKYCNKHLIKEIQPVGELKEIQLPPAIGEVSSKKPLNQTPQIKKKTKMTIIDNDSDDE